MRRATLTKTASETAPPPGSAGVNNPPSKPEVGRMSVAERRAFREALGPMRETTRIPRPITTERAALLDSTALALNKVEDADRIVLKVRNTLGLPMKKWNDAKMRSIRELGQYEYMKLCARVLLITGFSSVEQIEEALMLGRKMLADKTIAPEHRIAAGTMVSKCAQALTEISRELLVLAERGSDKSSEPSSRPRNLPPQVAVQVNVAGAPSPASATPAVFTAITGKG